MLADLFSNMSTLEALYWICAIVGGVILLLRIVMLFLGGDISDSDMDVGHADFGGTDAGGDFDGHDGHDGDDGFKILSLQTISSFMTMFGLVGLAAIKQSNLGPAWSLVAGTAGGSAMVWVMKFIFIKALTLQSSGNIDIHNAVGAEGTVYLTIPPSGIGKVRVPVQSRLKVIDARARDGQELKTGAEVKVVDIHSGSVLIVSKRD